MAKNPETYVTDGLRKVIESSGGKMIKHSDRFSRGIPDCTLATDRVFMVEVKEDSDGLAGHDVRTYKQLGMTGGQDSNVRAISARVRHGAVVFTATVDMDDPVVWVAVTPEREGHPFVNYRVLHRGERAFRWLLGNLT